MGTNNIIKEIEGQRGILQIVLYLQQNGETISGKLYNNHPDIEISNNSTCSRALKVLIKNKVIKKRKATKNRAIYYSLTPKGEKIAKCLNDIEELLSQ